MPAPLLERPQRVRLFVALALPAPDQASLARWALDVLGDDDALRLVEAAALHMTLVFLGQRDESDVERIAATTLGAVEGMAAPVLRPRELAALPPRRARVLALDVEDEQGRAAAVQAAVAGALADAGLHEAEARPFRPHVTVARVRRGGRAPTGRFPDPPRAAVHAAEVVLFRSELGPAGARYTALASATLAPGDP